MNKKPFFLIGGLILASLLLWGVIVAVSAYRFVQEAATFDRYHNVSYARKQLAANPKDGYAYEGIALDEVHHNDYLSAIRDLRTAWQLDPENHRAGGELAAALIDQHQYSEAAQVQEVMAKYHDDWGDAARKGLASYARYRKKHPNGP